MPPTTDTEHGYARAGQQDQSWPICANCKGFGTITQELAIEGAAGVKGDRCAPCNGVGRVHDASWPRCGCGGSTAGCPACHGLGLLSPQAMAELDARLLAAQGAAAEASGHLEALQTAARSPGYRYEAP